MKMKQQEMTDVKEIRGILGQHKLFSLAHGYVKFETAIPLR